MGDAVLPPPPPPPGSSFSNADGYGDVPGGNWEIRPPETLTATSVIGQGLRLWKRIALPGFLIVFVLQGIPTILAVAADGHICDGTQSGFSFSFETGDLSTESACQPGPVTQLVAFATLFVLPLIFVALLRMTTGSAVERREQGAGIGLRHASRRYGGALVVGLAFVLLMIGLVLPVVIAVALVWDSGGAVALVALLGVLWLIAVFVAVSLLYEVFLLEEVGGFRPIGRSWALVKRRFWGALGSLALYALIASAISVGVTLIPGASLSDTGFGAVVQATASAIAGAITTPIFAGILTTMYLRLRSLEEAAPISPSWVKSVLARHDSA